MFETIFKNIVVSITLCSCFYNNNNSYCVGRKTQSIVIPSSNIGTKHTLQVHSYSPPLNTASASSASNTACKKAYIQAGIHADETPGLLVANHLIHLLDKAEKLNEIIEEICIVPYANPIGNIYVVYIALICVYI